MKKRKRILTVLAVTVAVFLFGCGTSARADPEQADPADAGKKNQMEESETMIYAHIGDQVLEVLPENNSSAEAFVRQLAEGDITVELHDYGSFEKVGPLGMELPTNDERITTEPGDLILYQGDQITIYYDTNTWSFTRLGRVQWLSQEELKEVLGKGGVTVTFSLNGNTARNREEKHDWY